MVVFALLMIAAAFSMIRIRDERGSPKTPQSAQTFFIVSQGFAVGVVAGFVGAGGGFLIIPAHVLFAGLAMRLAIGTSLMIIALQSLIGFLGDILRGTPVNWPHLMTVAIMEMDYDTGKGILR